MKTHKFISISSISKWSLIWVKSRRCAAPPFSIQPVCGVSVSFVRRKCGLVTSAEHTGPLSPWGPMSGTAVQSSSPRLREGEVQSSGTYARRVQQVSPSTSPPGALSVLTDSFSLAGMLTVWWAEPEEVRQGEEGRESRVAGCCVICVHKSAPGPSETAVKNLTQYIITQRVTTINSVYWWG